MMLEEPLDMSVINHRNFILMLSPVHMDTTSERAGFQPASQDVMVEETKGVFTHWLELASTGVLAGVNDAARWIVDYALSGDDYGNNEDLKKMIVAGYYSYSVALLSYLSSLEMIDIIPQGDVQQNIVDFARNRPVSFNVEIIDKEGFTDE